MVPDCVRAEHESLDDFSVGFPQAIRSSISRSRWVSSEKTAAAVGDGQKKFTSRLAMAGTKMASPLAISLLEPIRRFPIKFPSVQDMQSEKDVFQRRVYKP